MNKIIVSSIAVVGAVFIVTAPVISQSQTADTAQQTVEERQAARRQKNTVKLTEAESRALGQKCQAAQSITKSIATNIELIAERRQAKYDQLTAKLTAISAKYAAEDIDTSGLDISIKQTQQLIDDFMVELEEHRLSIEDSSAVDCQASPEEFKLALDDARAQRKTIRDSAAAIREQIKTNVKNELLELKKLVIQKNVQTSGGSNTDDPDSPVSNSPEGN